MARHEYLIRKWQNGFRPFLFLVSCPIRVGLLGPILWQIENAYRKRKWAISDLGFSGNEKKLSYGIGFGPFSWRIFRSSVFDHHLARKWGSFSGRIRSRARRSKMTARQDTKACVSPTHKNQDKHRATKSPAASSREAKQGAAYIHCCTELAHPRRCHHPHRRHRRCFHQQQCVAAATTTAATSSSVGLVYQLSVSYEVACCCSSYHSCERRFEQQQQQQQYTQSGGRAASAWWGQRESSQHTATRLGCGCVLI